MTARVGLWGVAVDQYGYITTADASRIGVPVVEVAKLASRGGLIRVSQGVYRFPQWPVGANDHLMEAVLWTRDPTAALSYDTALDVLDLCDINPTLLHVTVSGRKYPIRRQAAPAGLTIHYEHLDSTQKGWWEQIPTVTAQTAIEQGIATSVRHAQDHRTTGRRRRSVPSRADVGARRAASTPEHGRPECRLESSARRSGFGRSLS